MIQEKKEKLIDYISTVENLDNSSLFSIASIIVDSDDNKNLVLALNEHGFKAVFIAVGVSEHNVVKKMIELFKKGDNVLLVVEDKFENLITEFLENLIDNRINVRLAGDKGNTVINPNLSNSKLILLASDTVFIDNDLQKFTTSVCRL